MKIVHIALNYQFACFLKTVNSEVLLHFQGRNGTMAYNKTFTIAKECFLRNIRYYNDFNKACAIIAIAIP